MCGYSQDTTDTFDWVRGSGATTTANTGPDADHTLGSASGMVIDSPSLIVFHARDVNVIKANLTYETLKSSV